MRDASYAYGERDFNRAFVYLTRAQAKRRSGYAHTHIDGLHEIATRAGSSGVLNGNPTGWILGMRWVGDTPPLEPQVSVPEIGERWEPMPMRVCTTCGYAETEPTVVIGLQRIDE